MAEINEINFVSQLAEIVYKAIQHQNIKNSKNSKRILLAATIHQTFKDRMTIPLICLLEIKAVNQPFQL